MSPKIKEVCAEFGNLKRKVLKHEKFQGKLKEEMPKKEH